MKYKSPIAKRYLEVLYLETPDYFGEVAINCKKILEFQINTESERRQV